MDYWKSLRVKLRAKDGVTLAYGESSIPGCHTIEVRHQDFPMPLAVVWFSFFGLNGIQIYNSFVFEKVRRCGLRTMIHEEMLRSYPKHYVISGAGTTSGQAWMKATGYRKTKAGWEFHR